MSAEWIETRTGNVAAPIRRFAFLFITHVWSAEIEDEFRKISRNCSGDAWLVIDSRTVGLGDALRNWPSHHLFTPQELRALLPYSQIPTPDLIGHAHFIILDFFRCHPGYDFYWFIEYDVRYTGEWASFFRKYDSRTEDFISAHVRWFVQEPLWPWWQTFSGPASGMPPPRRWLRSFNILYRVSAPALSYLADALRRSWRGHHETLMVTVLHEAGFRIADFGGDGPFAIPSDVNSSYTSHGSAGGYLSLLGTIRFRPVRKAAGVLKDKLYHPVKCLPFSEATEDRRRAYKVWHAWHERETGLLQRLKSRGVRPPGASGWACK